MRKQSSRRAGRRLVTTISAAASLLALMGPAAQAQDVSFGEYFTSVNGPVTNGDWTFSSSTLHADSASGVTGGTRRFRQNSGLQASVADAVTGGQQIFTGNFGSGPSVAVASATHALSGASIALYQDSYVSATATDALGSGASILFGGGLFGTQQLRLNGYNTTVGVINSTGGNGVITNAGGGAAAQFTTYSGAYSGVITNGAGGALGLVKAGVGTLTLSGSSNTYSGGTLINAGTLIATNGGALGSGNIAIGSGATLQAAGTLANVIDVSGTITNGSGTIGTLTTGAQTWNGGGAYAWDIANATGAAGTGYDLLAINGGLGIASTPANKFTVAMNSVGRVAGFDSTTNYTWTLAQTSGITGFDVGDIAIDSSHFSNGFNGAFSIGTSGSNLVLTYTGAAAIVHDGDGNGDTYTSVIGNIASGLHQVNGFVLWVDTAGGLSGGDTNVAAENTIVTHEDGITGGYQKITSPSVALSSTRSITGGTQVFESPAYVAATATDAITGGLQVFNDANLTIGEGAGGAVASISGGEQRFYGGGSAFVNNGLGVSTGSSITGGTQKFYDDTYLSSGGTISGGVQEFHNDSYFRLGAGALSGGTQDFYDRSYLRVQNSAMITGGTQNFHDLSYLWVQNSGGVSGATLNFHDGSRLRVEAAGAVNNSSLILSGNTQLKSFTGGISNSSIELRENAQFLVDKANPLTSTTISFNGGGGVALSNYGLTVTGLQSLTAGAGYVQDVSSAGANITLAVDLGGTATNTFSGIIGKSATSTLNLLKTGTGTLILSGANSYGGTTTVNGGTLHFAKASALYEGALNSASAARITVASGATARFNVGGADGFTSAHITALNSATFAAGSTLALDTANAAAAFGQTGNMSGSYHLAKVGAGTLVLSGTNTYTGDTTIAAGTLQFANPASFYNSVVDATRAAKLTIASGATAAFNAGGAGEFTAANIDTLRGAHFAAGSSLGIDTTNAGVNGFLYPTDMAGSVGLTKLGTGSLVLTGASTHTGVTLVSAGTLQIGDGGTTGSVTGPITTNATLAFNRSDSFTHAGDISGTGGLAKSGSGTLTLSGTNTYTGDTAINAGTLTLGASNRLSDVTRVVVGTGATFSLGGFNETVGNVSGAGTIALDGGALTAGDSATTTLSGAISGLGSFTKVGGGTLIVTGTLSAANTTVSTGSIQVGDGGTLGSLSGNVINNAHLTFNRSDSSTYAGNTSGGGDLTKLGAGTLTLTGTNTYAGDTLITAGTLALGATNSLSTTGRMVVGSGATFALENFDASVASISGAGNIALGSATLTTTNYGLAQEFSGTLSGTGGFTMSDSSITRLAFSGTNTYSGATTINGGELTFAQRTAFYNGVVDNTTAARLTVGSGGFVVFQVGGAGEFTSSDIAALNSAHFAANSTLTLDAQNAPGSSFTFDGNLNGSMRVVATNLIVTGNLNNTGRLLVYYSLRIGDGGTTGSVASDIYNYGSVIFNRADNIAYSGGISQNGSLQKQGGGTLTLSGANTYAGNTTVSAGTLQFAKTASFYNSTIDATNVAKLTVASGTTAAFNVGGADEFTAANIDTLRGANFASGAKLGLDTTNSGGAFTYGSNIGNTTGGSLGLTKLGTGSLILSGTNTYTGGTTASAGTLQFAKMASFYNGIIDATNAAKLTVASGATAGFNVGDTGEFTSAHLDTLRTSGGFAAGSFLGLDTTNAGGTFTYGSNIGDTTGGALGLNKLGTGTLALNGVNTYTGGTTLNAGTLTAGGTSAFGTGTVRINAGTLNLGGFAVTNALDVRGGSLTGLTAYAGTQTVSGAASYSGTVSGTNLVADGGTLNTTGAIFTGATTVQFGGTLKGTGTLGSVTIESGGTLAPGNSPGLLTVNGDLTYDSGTFTNLEIGGLDRGAIDGYDGIDVSGTLTADGTLTISFIDGFTPTAAATFDFFNFTSFVGAFDGVVLPDAVGYTWDTSQLSVNGSVSLVTAVPEPSSWAALAGLGAFAATVLRRRRSTSAR